MSTDTATTTTNTPTSSPVQGTASGPLLTRELLAFGTFAYRAAVVGLLAYIAVTINSGVRASLINRDGSVSGLFSVWVENSVLPVRVEQR